MQRAHVLLHPSRIEGGAQAVIEAIRGGTPVIASRIDGNTGLLGTDYPGLFAPGDAAAAARLLRRAATMPRSCAGCARSDAPAGAAVRSRARGTRAAGTRR